LAPPNLVYRETIQQNRMSYRQKSFAAFKISMEALTVGDAYMWTLTWPTATDVTVVRKAWNHFLNGGSGLLRCFPLVSGLRVFEMHPGEDGEHSHGLHIHFVVDQRLPIDIVRIIAARASFGRIHVKKIKEKKHALYLSKYLQKQERDEALASCRLWAVFGNLKGSKVKDIGAQGERADVWRYLKVVVHGWKNVGFGDKAAIAEEVLGGAQLEEAFEAVGWQRLTEPSWALQYLDQTGREKKWWRDHKKRLLQQEIDAHGTDLEEERQGNRKVLQQMIDQAEYEKLKPILTLLRVIST
jgi:hypothetical protein